jgi:hypothetical protein
VPHRERRYRQMVRPAWSVVSTEDAGCNHDVTVPSKTLGDERKQGKAVSAEFFLNSYRPVGPGQDLMGKQPARVGSGLRCVPLYTACCI